MQNREFLIPRLIIYFGEAEFHLLVLKKLFNRSHDYNYYDSNDDLYNLAFQKYEKDVGGSSCQFYVIRYLAFINQCHFAKASHTFTILAPVELRFTPI